MFSFTNHESITSHSVSSIQHFPNLVFKASVPQRNHKWGFQSTDKIGFHLTKILDMKYPCQKSNQWTTCSATHSLSDSTLVATRSLLAVMFILDNIQCLNWKQMLSLWIQEIQVIVSTPETQETSSLFLTSTTGTVSSQLFSVAHCFSSFHDPWTSKRQWVFQ